MELPKIAVNHEHTIAIVAVLLAASAAYYFFANWMPHNSQYDGQETYVQPLPTAFETPVELKITLDPQKTGCVVYEVNGYVSNNPDYLDWDWGDGSQAQTGWFPQRHLYCKPGNYTVKVVAYKGTLSRVAASTVIFIEGDQPPQLPDA